MAHVFLSKISILTLSVCLFNQQLQLTGETRSNTYPRYILVNLFTVICTHGIILEWINKYNHHLEVFT